MSDEVKNTLNDINVAVKALRDEAVTKGAVDVLVEEKMTRINSAIDDMSTQLKDLEKRAARPPATEADEQKENEDEHRLKFSAYVRKGVEFDKHEMETKAFHAVTVGADPQNGYAIPKLVDAQINDRLVDISPMRQLARVVQTSSNDFRFLNNNHGTNAFWVGETDLRPETDAPKSSETQVPMGEIYSNPQASQRVLDDAAFDVEAFLATEIALTFAQAEGAAFINGNGTNKPRGILNYATAATGDASRPADTLQHVMTGKADGLGSADAILSLVLSLRSGFRAGAKLLIGSTTVHGLRILKDSNGAYLWTPMGDATSQKVAGYEIIEDETMPTATAGASIAAFGNFERGYLIADRIGIRTLRDPYTNKPFVGFYTTKRVGGCVVDASAIKILKVGV